MNCFTWLVVSAGLTATLADAQSNDLERVHLRLDAGQLSVNSSDQSPIIVTLGNASQTPPPGTSTAQASLGLLKLREEAKKTIGYYVEAYRMAEARSQAEAKAREALRISDGFAIVVVSANRALDFKVPDVSSALNEYFVSNPQVAKSLDAALQKVLGEPVDTLRTMQNRDLLGLKPVYPRYMLLATRAQGSDNIQFRHVSMNEQEQYMASKANDAAEAKAKIYEDARKANEAADEKAKQEKTEEAKRLAAQRKKESDAAAVQAEAHSAPAFWVLQESRKAGSASARLSLFQSGSAGQSCNS